MRNFIKYGIFLIAALSLLTLNVSALSSSSDDNIKLENNNDEPIEIGICIEFELYTHEELSNYSDTIVIGTVKEILPPRWNTIDGKQPNKTRRALLRENVIYTDVVISVDEYLKNPLTSREVTVRTTGGKIGKVNMTTDSDPSFKVGEKVLLFLSKDYSPDTKDFGPEYFIVTDFYLGKYTLTDDGKAVRPDENTTLEELLSTIKDSNDTEGKSKFPESGNKDEVACNDEPLYAEVSGSLIGLNHTELSKNSDTVIIGTVKEILPSKWNNADGKNPGQDIEFDLNNTIYTDTIIIVDEYLKNPLSSKEVRVRVEGGTVGNDTLLSECEPAFQPAERVLLYLMKDDNPATRDISPEHFIVTGALQGKYTLTDDGKAVRPDETVNQEELLSTINQADKRSAPFMSSFFVVAAFLWAVSAVKRR
ncbi:hypothetical protein RSJ42_05815 [Methanosarcina hadiensis]|uniref:hypothetical protein n=1 Tax=Methanosarcina hadiensis TaxID=3078083 RepID=UPI003977D715